MKTAKELLTRQLQHEAMVGKCAAKWAPREKSAKSKLAKEFREFFGMTPRQYRKTLVGLTNVVETQMCANDFKNINFSHVPSVASSRYKKAFQKHAPVEYADYASKLAAGDKTVKINANAIFPHDVLKDVLQAAGVRPQSTQSLQVIKAQWEALPDYVGDASALAIVDVSGSMSCSAGGSSVTCHQIASSLGLYLADKNRGPFKDTFLTFSSNPELLHLKGDIIQKLQQMNQSSWNMSTDVIKAFKKILDTALAGNAKQEDMPKTLIIFSDMQFNQCAAYDDTAFNAMGRMFANAGYVIPNVVFWNLNGSNNVPVKSDSSGAALVSGFSPAVLTAILGSPEEFTPRAIMEKAVMVPRYDLVV